MPTSKQPLRGEAPAHAHHKECRPRLHLRLKARQLESLPPGRHPDGDGLMLQVTKNGSRSWLLRTVVHGRRRDIGLGSLQHVTLAQARDEARQLRAALLAPGGPNRRPQEAQNADRALPHRGRNRTRRAREIVEEQKTRQAMDQYARAVHLADAGRHAGRLDSQ